MFTTNLAFIDLLRSTQTVAVPKITVVIPLFNKESTILRALESVQAQQWPADEVLVVDNASTDAGPAMVKALGWDKLRLLHEAHPGVSHARNAGIAAASGTHIAFLDADDAWAPGFLRQMHALIQSHPEAGLYASGYVFRTGSSDRRPDLPGLGRLQAGLLHNYFGLIARHDMLVTASSVCIPKAVLLAVGGFPVGERIGEDQDVWARIALQYPIAYDPQVLAIYFQDAANMATRKEVDRQEWPFIARLEGMQGLLPPPARRDLRRYLSWQLVGQASMLVLAKDFGAARQLLHRKIARLSGLRFLYWWFRARFNC